MTTYEYFFVYGTLMSYTNTMGSLTDGEASLQGTYVHIQARMYDIGAFPSIKLSNSTDDKVVGELWLVPSKYMNGLDVYEQEGRMYIRVKVVTDCGILAWTYTNCNMYLPEKRHIPSGDWLAHCENVVDDLCF